MLKTLCIIILSCLLIACASATGVRATSDVQQGKRYFDQGYYKRALHQLLPPACDGNAEAQYAVGYMYYYGYGAAQDTDTGYFWIKRSADQHYLPAVQALATMNEPGQQAAVDKSQRPS